MHKVDYVMTTARAQCNADTGQHANVTVVVTAPQEDTGLVEAPTWSVFVTYRGQNSSFSKDASMESQIRITYADEEVWTHEQSELLVSRLHAWKDKLNWAKKDKHKQRVVKSIRDTFDAPVDPQLEVAMDDKSRQLQKEFDQISEEFREIRTLYDSEDVHYQEAFAKLETSKSQLSSYMQKLRTQSLIENLHIECQCQVKQI
jgi:hypothetical protein